MVEADLRQTPTGFAVAVLGMNPYDWQATALEWYHGCLGKRVQGSLATPNGAGKDTVVIAALALWWIFVHARGRVIITSSDGKQIEDQTRPAIHRHRGKFDGWEFNMWTVKTPTGGSIRLYSTDDPGRVEGAHRDTHDDGTPDPDGPLLIIANEAKSIHDDILDAFDRCTFDGLLYASSPGYMRGRFYESQFMRDRGFKTLRVGLKDCPHIPPERIAAVIQKHGKDSAFARSTLDGEFMEETGEVRFDLEGLKALRVQSDIGHDRAKIVTLQVSAIGKLFTMNDSSGWLWVEETPQPGGEYLLFCDPNTCEQGEGNSERDNTACGVLRKGYISGDGIERPDHIVAVLHWQGGVKWDSDVLAVRMKLLADWYGKAMTVVEANNFGSALIKDLQREGVRLWRRTRVDDKDPNKKISLLGFLTTERTREHWVQACSKALRMNEDGEGNKSMSLRCAYKPAVDEFHSFIFTPDGRGEAQPGTHDDWCAGIGIGLTVRCFTMMPNVDERRQAILRDRLPVTKQLSPFGACG